MLVLSEAPQGQPPARAIPPVRARLRTIQPTSIAASFFSCCCRSSRPAGKKAQWRRPSLLAQRDERFTLSPKGLCASACKGPLVQPTPRLPAASSQFTRPSHTPSRIPTHSSTSRCRPAPLSQIRPQLLGRGLPRPPMPAPRPLALALLHRIAPHPSNACAGHSHLLKVEMRPLTR